MFLPSYPIIPSLLSNPVAETERLAQIVITVYVPSSKHVPYVQMQAAGAAGATPAAPPPQPPRRRAYTAVDPRCEWTRTEDADTLVVDISGFRKEELKVLYNTSRKLKVTGERQADGGQRARFLKMFPVPRSCNAGAIRAVIDKEEALLYVILPKGSSSSSSSPPSNSSMDKQKDDQNVSSEPQGGAAMADGSSSSSSSSGVLYSAQEDEEMGRMDDEKVVEREEQIATQDVPGTTHGDDVNGGNRRLWWQRARATRVLGIALILAVAAVGAYVLCLMLL